MNRAELARKVAIDGLRLYAATIRLRPPICTPRPIPPHLPTSPSHFTMSPSQRNPNPSASLPVPTHPYPVPTHPYPSQYHPNTIPIPSPTHPNATPIPSQYHPQPIHLTVLHRWLRRLCFSSSWLSYGSSLGSGLSLPPSFHAFATLHTISSRMPSKLAAP